MPIEVAEVDVIAPALFNHFAPNPDQGITVPKRENCTKQAETIYPPDFHKYYYGFVQSIDYTLHLDSGVKLRFYWYASIAENH